jgi:hypothetical protein
MHRSPAPQALPQEPQLLVSVCGSMQLPPHASWPAMHIGPASSTVIAPSVPPSVPPSIETPESSGAPVSVLAPESVATPVSVITPVSLVLCWSARAS